MADTQPKVFLSYSRKDIDFALRLQASLAARNVDTWMDMAKLKGG